MKKCLIIITIFLVALNSNADMGYYFKYEVRLTLDDETEIIGFFIFPTSDFFYKNISSLDTILKRGNPTRNDSITIFKEIIIIDSLQIDKNLYSINAIPEKSTITLCISSILESEILECSPATAPEKEATIKQDYYGYGGFPVIVELLDYEIQRLKNQKSHFSFIYRNCPDDILSSIIIISYNSDLNKEKLIEEMNKIYCPDGRNNDIESIQRYIQLKDYLRSINIIAFKNSW
jgi:hypothetical protein